MRGLSGGIRRLATVVLSVAIVLAAVAASVAAVRHVRGQRAPATVAPTAGALTAADGTSWTWSGPALCQAGAATTTLTRTRSGQGTGLRLPLVTVAQLEAADDRDLVAAGRDASCRESALLSTDGGDSWSARTDLAGARSVAAAPARSWWAITASGRLEYVRGGTVTDRPVEQPPCPPGVEPSLTSAASDREAWVLCQDRLGLRRTLLHTADGGTTWDVPGDELSNSGLDGVGVVATLDLHFPSTGWLLKPAARCPEGEIRTSSDGGNSWSTLPCPGASIPVTQIFSVRVLDAQHGLLLGVRGATTVTAHTSDGGRTWALDPGQ